MPLKDLSVVAVARRGRGNARDFEEQVHADREVGAIKETCPSLCDGMPDAGEIGLPSGSAHNHVFLFAKASLDVRQDRGRTCEVDDEISFRQRLAVESG